MVDKPKRTLTLDDSTFASNPGGLRVNYLYWIRSFPGDALEAIAPLLFYTGLTLAFDAMFVRAFLESLSKGKDLFSSLLPALFAIAVMNILMWWMYIREMCDRLLLLLTHIRERFIHGCVNPAVVVCTNPPLVAVCTDLTTGSSQHHAIKVLPQPLRWMKKGVPPVGTRLASVALYQGNAQKGHWDDFHPTVVDCVTGNREDIKRVFHSICDREWEMLDAGVNYLRTKKPGLYSIPFVHCEFCHSLTFLPLYWIHRQQHLTLLADGQMTDRFTQGLLDGVPQAYFHPHCGTVTRMPEEIIRSYLVNPFLANEYTFCCGCNNYVLQDELYWRGTGQCLADYFQMLQHEYIRIYGEPPL